MAVEAGSVGTRGVEQTTVLGGSRHAQHARTAGLGINVEGEVL